MLPGYVVFRWVVSRCFSFDVMYCSCFWLSPVLPWGVNFPLSARKGCAGDIYFLGIFLDFAVFLLGGSGLFRFS